MKKSFAGQAIFLIIIIAINITIGAWSISEILSWFGKDAPLAIDAIAGLFLGEVSIPIALIGKLISLF